jgi:hypothetical protein
MTDGCVHLIVVVVVLLLLHLPYNSSWKFHQLTPGQLLSGLYRYGTEKGRQYSPSITYKITPAGSLSSSQPGGPPCWVRPLAFGLIAYEYDDLHVHCKKTHFKKKSAEENSPFRIHQYTFKKINTQKAYITYILPIKSHKKLYGKLKIIILVCPQNLTNWLFHLKKLPT